MKLTRAEAAAFLSQRNDFCILTHRRPDGDTAGSAAALCLGLRIMGKRAHVLKNPEISGKLAFLHEGLTKASPDRKDTLVSVDTAAEYMLTRGFTGGKILLRIDHHGTEAGYTENELVDPAAAACGEIVYDILMEMGAALDARIAEALYVAISTDTGCFRFANTTAHTYAVAAACAATGAELYPITQALFDTNSITKLRIQSWIVENTKFMMDGKLAVCALPRALEEQATADDMDNISGFLRSIEGVKLCALLRQLPDGGIRASLRAVPGYDAAAVCRKFGGGGHKGAAGVTLNMPLDQAAQTIEAEMLKMF